MTMSESAFRWRVCVPAEHPSLPGHFPGEPIVPGVLLLEQVAVALRAWRGQRVISVSEAKFMRPLRPDQPAELVLEAAGEVSAGPRTRFVIRCGDEVLARGIVVGDVSRQAAA